MQQINRRSKQNYYSRKELLVVKLFIALVVVIVFIMYQIYLVLFN
jgi:hypothetical protein